MSQLPPLAALRAFEAAARKLSFKQAAEELGVTPTAISHQVRLLGETLGARPFERRPRQVALTKTGQELFPALRGAFASISEAIDRINNDVRRPGITLSATTAFTAKWLVPRLTNFGRANPEINLRIHASDDVVDLHRGSADAAIRYGQAPFPELIAEHLFEEHFAPICSARLNIRSPADLRHQTLLHSEWRKVDERTPTWSRWCQEADLHDLDTTIGPTFMDDSHLIQATVAGQGIALLSPVLVSDELSNAVLVQPFGPLLPGHGYYLVHTGKLDHAEEVKALKRWLIKEISGAQAA